MRVVAGLNAALRFVLELVGIVALGIWGWTAPGDSPLRFVLAVGALLALIVVWAVLIAPRSRSPLEPKTRFVVGSGLLLVAAGALWAAGFPAAAGSFAVLNVVNTALAFVFPLPEFLDPG
jgi:membrane protein YdbS with pleckstrin-like domain